MKPLRTQFSGGGGKNKHKSLVEEFAYPIEGTGMIYERMAKHFKDKGGNIFLQTPVKKIMIENNTVTALQIHDGTIKKYDFIISSMPLTTLIILSKGIPEPVKALARTLRFRNTVIVYLKVEAVDLFPDNWLYIHSDNLLTGRITNYRNWAKELYGKHNFTIIGMEYWCYETDPLWQQSDKELIDLAKKEIITSGLIKDKNTKIEEGSVYKIPKCYPVYEKGYKEKLAPIQSYLSDIKNLQCIGRYGAFKYNNQDHSILMGLLAAENITQHTQHDLWTINTDYESYQENAQSRITAEGLT